MAKLTAKQEAQLKRLQELQEAPDPPQVGRSFNISMSYEQAEKLGILNDLRNGSDDDESDDDDDTSDDDAPARRGFFGDTK